MDEEEMRLSPRTLADEELLHELAGITGVGWTASSLGFIGSLLWYGDGIGASHSLATRALLYLAIASFLATLGLDALRSVVGDAIAAGDVSRYRTQRCLSAPNTHVRA
mgnify:CR=1 FL=1